MLVLSRKAGSSILIGHDVVVTVEMISGDDVCLSVRAPDGVRVERLEENDVAAHLAERGKKWDPNHMYVLSRRPRPGLLVAGEVMVAVQSVSSEAVRIGIDAPAHVLIYREEVYQQMQEANRAAQGAADPAGLAGLAGPTGLGGPSDPTGPAGATGPSGATGPAGPAERTTGDSSAD